MDQPLEISLDQLRGMIGLEVRFLGWRCHVIEVLEDGPSLVLQESDTHTIQPDQYGNAGRRVPRTHTIPVLTGDRLALHPDFLDLELL
ncbi:MAG TPA: hypothetical protein ENK08_07355 [Chloroflexi bacterium]|nr:hypothetical protein [Chloroflexota bacterium]